MRARSSRPAVRAMIAAAALLLVARAAAAQESYVLAASWEPAFCSTEGGQRKKECRTQTADRYDATHLSLHGLWPDDLGDKEIYPCYCARGAPAACDIDLPDGPSIRLSQPVFDELRKVMPGVQSGLHRHEWAKHGSCSASFGSKLDPDAYFAAATRLINALNASPVRALFAKNIGRRLTRRQIEKTFDEVFGVGASERLIIKCNGRGENATIAELWINLEGDIASDTDLADLILAAPPTSVSTSDRGCAGGKLLAVEAN